MHFSTSLAFDFLSLACLTAAIPSYESETDLYTRDTEPEAFPAAVSDEPIPAAPRLRRSIKKPVLRREGWRRVDPSRVAQVTRSHGSDPSWGRWRAPRAQSAECPTSPSATSTYCKHTTKSSMPSHCLRLRSSAMLRLYQARSPPTSCAISRRLLRASMAATCIHAISSILTLNLFPARRVQCRICGSR